MDAEAERVMKEQDAAKKRQMFAMGAGGRRGGGGGGRGYTEDYYAKYADEEDAGMDGDFLEASDDDEYDGGEAEAVAGRVAEKRKAREGGFEDEEGMSSDDGAGEKAAAVKKKRGRLTVESDSD